MRSMLPRNRHSSRYAESVAATRSTISTVYRLRVPAGELVGTRSRDGCVRSVVERTFDGFVFSAVTLHGPGHVMAVGVRLTMDPAYGGEPVRIPPARVPRRTRGSGDLHPANGLVTDPELRTGVHLDAPLEGCDAKSKAAVDGCLGRGQGGHGEAIVLGIGEIGGHHPPQDAMARCVPRTVTAVIWRVRSSWPKPTFSLFSSVPKVATGNPGLSACNGGSSLT